ncbi:MAG: hypothetical protein HY880_08665 [Deltaproteobacteria bacterium]|nr:hypothetical protein [Deltaproteobacteria bacterium]
MTGIFTAIAASLLIPAVTGFLLTSIFLKDDLASGALERLAMGYGLGTGVLTFQMFVLGLLGLPLTLSTIMSMQVAAWVALFFVLWRSGAVKAAFFARPCLERPSAGAIRASVSAVIALYLLAKAGLLVGENMLRPIHAVDTWTNWSSGAKFFFYEKGFLLDTANEHYFGKGYRLFLGHPLHTPLLEVWTALWLGRFDEVYVKAWSTFYFIGLVGVFYCALRREADRFHALAWSFFLSGVPLFAIHAVDVYADLPLAYYGLASTVCLYRFVGSGHRGALVLLSLFLGMAVFTKNEGLFLVFGAVLSLSLYAMSGKRVSLSTVSWFVVPFLIICGPWLAFKAVSGLGFGHSGHASGFAWLSDPHFGPDASRGVHWEVLWAALRETLFTPNHAPIFVFWIFLAAIGLDNILKSDIRYLYVMTLGVMAAFVFIYLLLEATAVIDATGIHRNALSYVPAMFFSSALLLKRLSSPLLHRGNGDKHAQG